jgi:hypothetical protein
MDEDLKRHLDDFSSDIMDLCDVVKNMRVEIKDLSDSVFRLLHFVEEDRRKLCRNGSAHRETET